MIVHSMSYVGLGLAVLFGAARVAAHPFHESQAEIDYRSACQCLEITLRVKPEEIEAALVRGGAPRLPLEHPHMQALLKDYILRHFALNNTAQEPVALSWVGAEIDALGAWIYLQSAAVKLPLQLRHEVLLEDEAQQVNRVLVRVGAARQGLSFSRDTERVQWIRSTEPAPACPEPCDKAKPDK